MRGINFYFGFTPHLQLHHPAEVVQRSQPGTATEYHAIAHHVRFHLQVPRCHLEVAQVEDLLRKRVLEKRVLDMKGTHITLSTSAS